MKPMKIVKIFYKTILYAFILLLFIYLSWPIFLHRPLQTQVKKLGYAEDFYLVWHPFDMALEVKNLWGNAPASRGQGFATLRVNVAAGSLWRGQLRLEEILLDGAKFTWENRPNNQRLAGFYLPSAKPTDPKADNAPASSLSQQLESLAWLRLDHLQITQSQWRLLQNPEELPLKAMVITSDLHLQNLHFHPDATWLLSTNLGFLGGQLQTQSQIRLAEESLAINMKWQNLSLKNHQAWLPPGMLLQLESQGEGQILLRNFAQPQISYTGDLQLEGLQFQQDNLRLTEGAVRWQGYVATSPLAQTDEAVSLSWQGQVDVDGQLSTQTQQQHLGNLTVQWQIRTHSKGQASALAQQIQGQVQVPQLHITSDNPQLSLQNLQLDVDLQRPQHQPMVVNAQLQLDKLDARLQHQGQEIPLAWENMLLDKFALKGQNWQLQALSLDNLRLGRVLNPAVADTAQVSASLSDLLQLGKIRGQNLSQQGQQLQLGHWQLEDLALQLIQNPQGQWQGIPIPPSESEPSSTSTSPNDAMAQGALVQTTPSDPAQPEVASPAEDALHWTLDSLVLRGHNPIHLSLQSVQPQVQLPMQLGYLGIFDADSHNPLPASWNLQLQLQEAASLEAYGEVLLLNPKSYTAVQARIQGLDLYPLSPWLQQAMGYPLESGQLNAKVEVNIQDTQISGNNTLVLKALTLGESQDDTWQDKLGMPLNLAMDLLKDDDGVVTLEIPLDGDTDQPNVTVQGIFDPALQKALLAGSRYYLAGLFQPYATIWSVGSFVYDQATAVRFDPVTFAPGQSQWQEEPRAFLTKVQTLLKDRPQVTLKLCGYTQLQDADFIKQQHLAQEVSQAAQNAQLQATAENGEVEIYTLNAEPQVAEKGLDLNQALHQLAQDRQSQLKNHLVQNYGVNPHQLTLCNPKHHNNQDQPPGVELRI